MPATVKRQNVQHLNVDVHNPWNLRAADRVRKGSGRLPFFY